ncbi:MAG: nitroreductase family deazaflavin-dependent oxidoreductase [Actinobacteria bacterium ATB1]|nr:nitroreductase family deazaflavin-dependent oxidoreductase [Actinobacteria bacterium ATB1]
MDADGRAHDSANAGMGGGGTGSPYVRLVNRFSSTPAGSWLVRNLAAKVDPFIFTATNGRFTVTGVPTLPMLTLTCIGARSGRERKVQLAYHRERDDLYVVASAMGQEAHPAWRANLLAHPDVTVQLRGRTMQAKAIPLTDGEKAEIWPRITRTIPQMKVYEKRTDRKLTVFRLTPA